MQQQEQEIPPEKHEVAVRLVLLDVIVTKGGEFVKDLTKDDFELFKELPFYAEFVPFVSSSGKFEPWIGVALPTKELFLDRYTELGPKKFNLHVWIYDEVSGEKGFGGQIDLPLNIDTNFLNYVKKINALSFNFKGPEIEFKPRVYKSVFALVDPLTNEIGTWESSFFLPDFEKKEDGAIVNCVLGDITGALQKGATSFELSRKDVSLTILR